LPSSGGLRIESQGDATRHAYDPELLGAEVGEREKLKRLEQGLMTPSLRR